MQASPCCTGCFDWSGQAHCLTLAAFERLLSGQRHQLLPKGLAVFNFQLKWNGVSSGGGGDGGWGVGGGVQGKTLLQKCVCGGGGGAGRDILPQGKNTLPQGVYK